MKISRRKLSGPLALLPALLLLAGCGRPQELEGRYRGGNLVWIVIDTLRADHLGCYGYPRPATPALDEFSRESLLFTNATVSMGITLPSHATLLTGLYPQNTGVLRNWGRVDDSLLTMAEALGKAGYRTGAVVSTAVLKKEKNLGQGFDQYLENFASGEWEPDAPGQDLRRKGTAGDALDSAWDWIEENRPGPFFLFVNLYDVHWPFIVPEEFRGRFSGAASRETPAGTYTPEAWAKILADPAKLNLIDEYDEALAYADAEIGKFLRRLRESGLGESTLVAVSSDHGEELYGHRDYPSHGLYLYDGVVRIPLLLRLPDRARSGTFENPVDSVDIFPSFLDLLGVSAPGKTDGRSFLAALKDPEKGRDFAFALRVLEDENARPLPRQYMIRGRGRKLIHSPDGESEFYFLERDPRESRDEHEALSGRERKNAAGMKARGEAWFRPGQLLEGPPEAPDPETARELRALGYLK